MSGSLRKRIGPRPIFAGRLIRAGSLWALMVGASPALGGLTAVLSATSVGADQPVVLTLTQTGPDGAEPDLTPLQTDFRIAHRSSRREVRVTNGQRQERHELRLTLVPVRAGTLTVPALQAGDESTDPIELVVSASAVTEAPLLPSPTETLPEPIESPAPSDLSVEARIAPQRVLQDQQAVLVARVTSEQAMPLGRMHTPVVTGARVLPLGEDRRVEAAGDQGRHIFERRFAIFPTETGTLRIPPLQFDAWRTAGGSPKPFRSKGLSIRVDPRPDGQRPGRWLPARSLSLTEAGPPQVRIAPGQTLERLITVRADGIMASDLPPIDLEIPFPLRIHDDPPRLWNERTPDGVIGYRSQRVLIGAAESGVYTLPGPSLDWWSTETEAWERSTLPDWTLTVAAFASQDRRPAATWSQPYRPSDELNKGQAADRALPPPDPGTGDASGSFWMRVGYWTAALAGLAALMILLVLVRRRGAEGASSGQGSEPAPAPDSDAELRARFLVDEAAEAVERAYGSGNARAAQQALLRWGAAIWPEAAPANLTQLATRVRSPLREQVLLLDKSFFSPTHIDWSTPGIAEHLRAETQRKAP